MAIDRGRDGNLISASAEGHAGMGKIGTDIVCAAVTVLLRTTMAVLSNNEKKSGATPKIEVESTGRGHLAFRVKVFSEADIPFLKYAADFLLEGLQSLEAEYPDAVKIIVDEQVED